MPQSLLECVQKTYQVDAHDERKFSRACEPVGHQRGKANDDALACAVRAPGNGNDEIEGATGTSSRMDASSGISERAKDGAISHDDCHTSESEHSAAGENERHAASLDARREHHLRNAAHQNAKKHNRLTRERDK